MWKVFVYSLLLCFVAEVGGEPARYDGYKLLRVKARHERDLEAIKRMYDSADERLDFWREPRSVHREVDIMVSPQHEEFAHRLLKRHGLTAQKIMDDIQSAVDEQMKVNEEETEEDKLFFANYQNLSEITTWLYTLSAYHPDIVSVFQIATSYEKRPIHCLKLAGSERPPGTVKPAVFIMGGIHAREWISPSTVMFMAKELAEGYDNDREMKVLLDNLDWYILPVTNVDGYVFTWESYRLWRKTRSEYKNNQCKGVDPNRNWGFHWGVSGVSEMSCDDTYAGPFAFSETEVRQLAKNLTKLNQKQPIVAFMDFHAYSQLWMTPYGYDSVLPENYLDQYHLAWNATEALRAINGTDYLVGNIADVIYKASGNSVDWASGVLHVPYAYAVELPDIGRYGFLMPPRFIIPVGEETLEAVKVIGHGVIEYSAVSKMAPGLTTA